MNQDRAAVQTGGTGGRTIDRQHGGSRQDDRRFTQDGVQLDPIRRAPLQTDRQAGVVFHCGNSPIHRRQFLLEYKRHAESEVIMKKDSRFKNIPENSIPANEKRYIKSLGDLIDELTDNE